MYHKLERGSTVQEGNGVKRAQIVVCGGGVAGVAAAVSAAREGASVVLIEEQGFLGGMATAGMVSTFCGFYTSGPKQQQIVKGFGEEVVDELRRRNAVLGPVRSGHMNVLLYDATVLKLVLDDLVAGHAVDLLFHSRMIRAEHGNGRVRAVTVQTKHGPLEVQGERFIDCSGDGDLVFLAGGSFELEKERLQAGSLMFRMAGVDVSALFQLGPEGLRARVKEALQSGAYRLPREDGNIIPLPRPGEVVVGFSRLQVDGTSVESLSRAEVEGRMQVREIARFLREQIPGFQNAYIAEIAPRVGIRETRRVLGEYQLTEQDVLEGRKFDDAIAMAAWPIEYHPPQESSTRVTPLTGDDTYDIPFRCLLPRDFENVLVAGRCLSATGLAHASARVMASCMAMGQAAGTAAALSLQLRIPPRRLDHRLLKEKLAANGALLSL
jgi:hypothetical protein